MKKFITGISWIILGILILALVTDVKIILPRAIGLIIITLIIWFAFHAAKTGIDPD